MVTSGEAENITPIPHSNSRERAFNNEITDVETEEASDTSEIADHNAHLRTDDDNSGPSAAFPLMHSVRELVKVFSEREAMSMKGSATWPPSKTTTTTTNKAAIVKVALSDPSISSGDRVSRPRLTAPRRFPQSPNAPCAPSTSAPVRMVTRDPPRLSGGVSRLSLASQTRSALTGRPTPTATSGTLKETEGKHDTSPASSVPSSPTSSTSFSTPTVATASCQTQLRSEYCKQPSHLSSSPSAVSISNKPERSLSTSSKLASTSSEAMKLPRSACMSSEVELTSPKSAPPKTVFVVQL